jgi:hypothetical protein
MNQHTGSTLDDFLKEEGVFEDTQAVAIKRVIAWQLAETMKSQGITKTKMPSTTFNNSTGWTVSATGLESIVTRAPTHEPWPYHNQGVAASVSLQNGQTTASPNSPDVDDGWSITKE